MFSKFLSLSVALFLAVSAQAQTKTVPLASDPGGATLGVYEPDPLVRPTGTAVVICDFGQSDALEKTILGDLSKAGCAGFSLRRNSLRSRPLTWSGRLITCKLTPRNTISARKSWDCSLWMVPFRRARRPNRSPFWG